MSAQRAKRLRVCVACSVVCAAALGLSMFCLSTGHLGFALINTVLAGVNAALALENWEERNV